MATLKKEGKLGNAKIAAVVRETAPAGSAKVCMCVYVYVHESTFVCVCACKHVLLCVGGR